MKTVRNLLSVMMLTVLVSGATSNLHAQGRGNERRRENPGRDNKDTKIDKPSKDRSDRDRSERDRSKDWSYDNNHRDRDRNDRNDHRDYRDRHDSRHDRYASRNDRYYNHGRHMTYRHRYTHAHRPWAPVYGYRYNTRYIYYRDHNLYYDCYRDVFVTWSGRGWVVTRIVPDVICHVDFGRASVVGVDYWDDDFDFYLAKRRPSYISIQASW